MFRNDNPTSAASLPAPAATVNPGYFSDGNPGTGTPATVVEADWANGITEELMSILAAAGIAPVKTNNAQVLAALRQIVLGKNSRIFVASGSFVVPAGIVAVRVTAVGGGGSGGGTTATSSSQISVAAGGNAGCIASGFIGGLVPGTSIAVTIGAGGPWSSGGSGAGGSSSFGPYVTALGGNGPGANVPANPWPLIQGAYPPINQASGGTVNGYENPGQPGLGIGALNYLSGAGGSCGMFGSGGAAVGTTSANGNTGVGFGAGGSGGATGTSQTAKAGGYGAPGIVVVEW